MTHYTNTGNPIDFPKLSTIDKLWGKALDRVVPDTYSSLSLTQVEKVKTVFAELIVAECVKIGDNYEDILGNEPECFNCRKVAYGIVDKIKEHFGVEE